MSEVTIGPLRPVDWQLFVSLAHGEGWRVPASELALLQGPLGAGAYVLHREGRTGGYVSAVAHQRSGWVGNLLVPREERGRGHGSYLFDHAVRALETSGAVTLWLTASAQGRPIYERRGFAMVGEITRWIHPGTPPSDLVLPGSCDAEFLLSSDARAWGEERPLLGHLLPQGTVLQYEDSVALLQQGRDLQVLGPWLSPDYCPRKNRQILAQVMNAAIPGVEIVADILTSSGMEPLLNAAGFAPHGTCALMARGTPQPLTGLIALASLGSMG